MEPVRATPPPDVITQTPRDDHETWNTCPTCHREWKDPVATPGVIHRTQRCARCIEASALRRRRRILPPKFHRTARWTWEPDKDPVVAK